MSSSWQDRVRPEIKLTSPSGLVFTPGWQGNDMSFEKNVALFNYPMINGTLTQDLGRGGFIYPLTLYFEGIDNDRESLRFMKAAGDEPGPWTVIHPVDGQLTLQLIDVPQRPVQPITSGNLTVVTTKWVVPIEAEGVTPVSSTELATKVDDSKNTLDAANEAAAKAQTVQSLASEVASTVASARRNLNALKKSLVSMTARVNAIANTINSLLTDTIVDMSQVSGAVISLLESPDLLTGSVVSKLQMLRKIGNQFIKNLPTAARLSLLDRNAAVVGEMYVSATLSAMAVTVTSGVPETRTEALAMLSTYIAFSSEVTAALDALNSRTATSGIEDQYFGGIASAEAMANLRADISKYLLSLMGDLKKERRFTLKTDRHSFEIACTEYEATADTADYYYALFCRSNTLHGREVLLLTRGTEVVIYE